ncbi:hypothetical protein QWY79_04520 [Halomonas sabkhae]|uniref:hypothetical protein n=1 Tax=Halomonas sabkhae TaxID=626223 RepID=UPI0025B38A64|nr:hypothetical protein [Halomonas sabkhae]MDN3524525.1 hypothetical protein [Halomonas sabkhae]
MTARMRVLALMVVLLLGPLAGCASTPAPVEPLSGRLAGSVSEALDASVRLLLERGYVVRHADGDLGRVEAVLARWPGYRIRLQVEPAERGSRIEMTAFQGGHPLPPALLQPWLMTLRSRLGAG